MANWINPKQDWGPQAHPRTPDFNRIEGNTEYLKEQTDDHQRQIDDKQRQIDDKQAQIAAIKNGEAVPNAVHAGTADNAANAAALNGAKWQLLTGSVTFAAHGNGIGYWCNIPLGSSVAIVNDIPSWGRNPNIASNGYFYLENGDTVSHAWNYHIWVFK